MKNTEIQSRVNEALKEPMIALIENDDNAAEYIGDVKIYIAYKTEEREIFMRRWKKAGRKP